MKESAVEFKHKICDGDRKIKIKFIENLQNIFRFRKIDTSIKPKRNQNE